MQFEKSLTSISSLISSTSVWRYDEVKEDEEKFLESSPAGSAFRSSVRSSSGEVSMSLVPTPLRAFKKSRDASLSLPNIIENLLLFGSLLTADLVMVECVFEGSVWDPMPVCLPLVGDVSSVLKRSTSNILENLLELALEAPAFNSLGISLESFLIIDTGREFDEDCDDRLRWCCCWNEDDDVADKVLYCFLRVLGALIASASALGFDEVFEDTESAANDLLFSGSS